MIRSVSDRQRVVMYLLQSLLDLCRYKPHVWLGQHVLLMAGDLAHVDSAVQKTLPSQLPIGTGAAHLFPRTQEQYVAIIRAWHMVEKNAVMLETECFKYIGHRP